MDNLTHSIIGLIAGHAAAQIHERRASVSIASATQVTDAASSRRVLYGLIGVIGGNLPDTDLLLTLRGGGGDKLAYLLDHRGYTHTVAGGAVLALLLFAGVHPFWPWDDAWRYGDSVFIVEPLYWAAAAPLIFLVRTPFARSLLWLLQAAAVALCVLSALVPVQ
ncbi:MAG: metal-dependent hydrolase, partial [Steroidobacteraceae bacterium]